MPRRQTDTFRLFGQALPKIEARHMRPGGTRPLDRLIRRTLRCVDKFAERRFERVRPDKLRAGKAMRKPLAEATKDATAS